MWPPIVFSSASLVLCLMYPCPFSDCPILPSSIPNGFVNGNGSVEGSQYKLSCRQGYSLVGRDTLFCNHKGAWSGSVPKCLKGNSTAVCKCCGKCTCFIEGTLARGRQRMCVKDLPTPRHTLMFLSIQSYNLTLAFTRVCESRNEDFRFLGNKSRCYYVDKHCLRQA